MYRAIACAKNDEHRPLVLWRGKHLIGDFEEFFKDFKEMGVLPGFGGEGRDVNGDLNEEDVDVRRDMRARIDRGLVEGIGEGGMGSEGEEEDVSENENGRDEANGVSGRKGGGKGGGKSGGESKYPQNGKHHALLPSKHLPGPLSESIGSKSNRHVHFDFKTSQGKGKFPDFDEWYADLVAAQAMNAALFNYGLGGFGKGGFGYGGYPLALGDIGAHPDIPDIIPGAHPNIIPNTHLDIVPNTHPTYLDYRTHYQ